MVSVVNGFAVYNRQPGVRVAGSAMVGAATVVAAAVATSRRGYVALASAAGWALVTNAADPKRARAIRAANAAGAAILAVTTAAGLRLDRPRR